MPEERKSSATVARESLYDLKSEELLISHLATNPSKMAGSGFEDLLSLFSGERRTLAEKILDVASKGDPVNENSMHACQASADTIGLFLRLTSIGLVGVSSETLIGRLRDVSARRGLASAASQAYAQAVEGKSPTLETISAMEAATGASRRILQGAESKGWRNGSDMGELIADIQWRTKNPGKIRGMEFGFKRLETKLDGLQGGKLYLIGARPSVGKTAFAGDVIATLCSAGIGTGMFSMEMPDLEIRQRLVTNISGVNPKLSLEQGGGLTKSDLSKLRVAFTSIKDWNIQIHDASRLDIETLCSEARVAVSTLGVRAIVVDYIQLLRGVEPKSRNSKQEEVSECSGKLKALAKELGVPVIALAQLKRTGNAYSSASKETELPRPSLESLKESGSLEQDADAVILLHRDINSNPTFAQAIIAKNRDGELGTVELDFNPKTTSFNEKYIQ